VNAPTSRTSPAALPLVWLVRAYQLTLSPLLPPGTCRYTPSCSQYALGALRRFGAVRGTYLAARRLLSCHPWARGGVHHVPDTWAGRNDPSLRLPRTPDPS